MPRPRIYRIVGFQPNVTYFKPAGVRMASLTEIILTVDEFESIRLKDLLGLDQGKAAKKMNISQPTFHRLLLSARKKLADAIINGKAIKIEGGNYKMIQSQGGYRRGFGGRGRMGGVGAGPEGICRCPNCGYEEPKVRGVPCSTKKCPKCGTVMIRGV